MNSTLPRANAKELLLWFLGRRQRYRVEGHSLWPILRAGNSVLVRCQKGVAAEGEVVVAQHPFINIRLVKMIEKVGADNGVKLAGLNRQESTDSRALGLFPQTSILGSVTSILA